MTKVAIINDTRITSHYGCMLVMENLLALLKKYNVEVVWTWNVSVDWRKHKKAIMQKPNVDAIIVNGEGTIHHSKDRKFAKALAEFAGFSNSTLKTPCYLINSTLFQNAEEEYNKLKEYRAIYVRDKGSLEELESFNLKGKYIPDLTFAYNAYKYSERKPTKGAVIVDSAIKEDNPILKRFAEAHHVPFKGMIVARRKNAKFIKSPRPYIKNIIKYLKTDRKISTSPATYIQYLREHSLVITGRYHTVSMCIKNQIPFVAIDSNTPKIRFLLNDALGETKRNIRISEIEQINLTNSYEYNNEELLKMSAFIELAENEIDTMIVKIIEDISNKSSGQYCY